MVFSRLKQVKAKASQTYTNFYRFNIELTNSYKLPLFKTNVKFANICKFLLENDRFVNICELSLHMVKIL